VPTCHHQKQWFHRLAIKGMNLGASPEPLIPPQAAGYVSPKGINMDMRSLIIIVPSPIALLVAQALRIAWRLFLGLLIQGSTSIDFAGRYSVKK
jgi:hypothetical protein